MDWCFQLYSARHTPLDETLKLVAEAGYSSVEAFRENFTDELKFKSALTNAGLALPSMHVNIDPLRDNLADCIRRASDFSCSHIVCPYLDESARPLDAAGWTQLAQELNIMAQRWKELNCTFAWHNHDFEFVPMADGALPMNLLLEHAPLMQWEIDVAWIVRAGANPLTWITSHSERLSACHLKDIAEPGTCQDEDGWADLSAGIVDWPALIKPLQQSSANLFVVEHDNPSDLNRFASRSINAANQLFQS